MDIVPHTVEVTTLGRLSMLQRANFDIDMLARYVHSLMACESEGGGINQDFLREHGFIPGGS